MMSTEAGTADVLKLPYSPAMVPAAHSKIGYFTTACVY